MHSLLKPLIATALFAFCFSIPTYSQVNLCISPGFQLNGFYVGYRLGDLVPQIGIQYLGISAKTTSSTPEFDTAGVLSFQTSTNELNFSAIIPNVGLRYYCYKSTDVLAYVRAGAFVPIVSISDSSNGTLFGDKIEISSLGIEAGFGAEYAVSKNFSVGGEVGFNSTSLKVTESNQTTVFNPKTGQSVPATRTYSNDLGIGMIYSRLFLNFQFGE